MRQLHANVFLLVVLGVPLVSQASGTPHCSENADKRISATHAPVSVFQAIKPGSSRHDVLRLVGEPSCLAGSGIAYDVYLLEDGRRIWVAYPDGTARWAFIEGGGDRREWLFGEPSVDKATNTNRHIPLAISPPNKSLERTRER
jgi:hypothetical protein